MSLAPEDYLSVSFSSTDYIGHLFGPSSLEMEDNLLQLDRALAELFADVDEKIGLANTLVVLSADHGGPEAPGYLNALKIPSMHVSPEEWDTEPAIAALKQKFGIGEELIESYFHPYVYLNRDLMQEHGLDPVEIEEAVAEALSRFEGVALAVSSSAMISMA